MTADSVNCTGDETCKWCNPEPLTLEGDIRYLKAHIETKDRQLADANKRVEIYRIMIDDLSAQTRALREENKLLNTHKRRYQEEILQLERHNEELFAALNSVRNTLMRASNDIETLIRVD